MNTPSPRRPVLPQLAVWLIVAGFVGCVAGWGGRLIVGALAAGFVLLVALVAVKLFRVATR